MGDVGDYLPGLKDGYDGSNDDFLTKFIIGAPHLYTRNYTAPTMASMFNALPRFSHSNDFSYLFSNTPDKYALGLLFIAVWITALYTFWLVILLILKFRGPKKVGVFAGFPYDETVESRKTTAGRVTLSFSASMVIICTIILVTKGLTELQSVSNKVDVIVKDVQKIELEVESIITNLRKNSAKAEPMRDQFVLFLSSDICPLSPGSITEGMIRAIGKDAERAMIDLDDFVDSYYELVWKGLKQTNITTNKIEKANPQFDSGTSVVIMLPYFIVPSFLLIAVGMGYFGVDNEAFYTFITWCILPLMILMTIAAIIGSGWMAFAIEANSDFCSPSPEVTIYNVMNRQFPEAKQPDIVTSLENLPSYPNFGSGDGGGGSIFDGDGSAAKSIPKFENFFYDAVMFYANQCDTTTRFKNPWSFLEKHYDDLGKARNVLDEFLRSMTEVTLAQLTQECGVNYEPIFSLLRQLQTYVEELSNASIRALNLVSCKNMVPLYTHVIYDATCTYSLTGGMWMLGCSLFIAFFGILCIMFRGAYYPLGYYYYETVDGEKSLYGGTSSSEEDDTNSDNDNYRGDSNNNKHTLIKGYDDEGSSSSDSSDDSDDDGASYVYDDDDVSYIEAMASTTMLESIDADVYADGIVIDRKINSSKPDCSKSVRSHKSSNTEILPVSFFRKAQDEEC